MPPPVFVVCEICGKKFSKRSLGIHQKQCLKKAESSMTHCTICGLPVSKDEYSAHVDDCKRHNPEMARAAAKGKGKAAPLTSVVPLHVKKRIESGGAATGPPSALDMPTKAVHNMEIPAFVPEDGDEEDGRVACRVCERKFKRDRIAKHQLICAKVSKKEIIRKRKMKVVSGEELRLRGTDFEKYKDSRTDAEWVSRWREEHDKIQAVAEANKEADAADAAAAAAAAAAAGGSGAAAAASGAAAAAASSGAGGGGETAEEISEIVRVGDRVKLDDGRSAIVRFKGPVFLMNKGTWFGIELEDATGKHAGEHKGTSYFDCPEGHGLFVRKKRFVSVEKDGPPPIDEVEKAAIARAVLFGSASLVVESPAAAVAGRQHALGCVGGSPVGAGSGGGSGR
ncbi:hypothetical protein FNF31_05691 [Cafeteria roenbergensis]|uniref:Uncharacterized protein n=1 Tax=Cafeteria roenbergensis TaxID=33653 RepID=A0A5A8CYK0_CAFRO|nr:hypothetical protein FNF31_05691 [Cafeteria roenbergensis]